MSSGGEALCLPAPAFPLLTSLPAAAAQFQRTHLRSCALLGPPRPALAGAPPPCSASWRFASWRHCGPRPGASFRMGSGPHPRVVRVPCPA